MKKLKEVAIMVAVLILPFISFEAEADIWGGSYTCDKAPCKSGFQLFEYLREPAAAMAGCGVGHNGVLYALPGKLCQISGGTKLVAHFLDTSDDDAGQINNEVVWKGHLNENGTRVLLNHDVRHTCNASWHPGSWHKPTGGPRPK